MNASVMSFRGVSKLTAYGFIGEVVSAIKNYWPFSKVSRIEPCVPGSWEARVQFGKQVFLVTVQETTIKEARAAA